VHTFTATIPADPSRLAFLRARLGRWLDENELPNDLKGRIVLAAHEAAADAIEDAAPGDRVDVTAAIADDMVTVEVTQTTQARSRRLEPFDHERVRGRGLILIQLLMARVDVIATPTEVKVRMTQAVGGATPARPAH
jgi:anti-sigma regulatory factor (Ser/Thr protein kinase)